MSASASASVSSPPYISTYHPTPINRKSLSMRDWSLRCFASHRFISLMTFRHFCHINTPSTSQSAPKLAPRQRGHHLLTSDQREPDHPRHNAAALLSHF